MCRARFTRVVPSLLVLTFALPVFGDAGAVPDGNRALDAPRFTVSEGWEAGEPFRGTSCPSFVRSQSGMRSGAAERAVHPERVLVRFRPSASLEAREAVHDRAGRLEVLKQYEAVSDLQLVRVQAGQVDAAIAAYAHDADVLYAEPDIVVYAAGIPDDSAFGELWGLHNTGQTVNEDDTGTPGADIQAVEAWDIWTGDPSFRVAVIDTGADYDHPDLEENIWTNPLEIPDNGLDDDGNGYVDDIHGYDFFNEDSDPMDDCSHGTHVSGTIGAIGNNALGVAGVNWQCKIVPVKFLSGG